MDRPNILWICTDQQRYDTLGCTGNPYVETPNLDGLAREGVCFHHAYCQSPVCAPSRASFLSGRYPRTVRVRQNGQDIPREEVLVSRVFADSGYHCGLVGKLHVSACHPSVEPFMERRIDDGYKVFHWSHHPGRADERALNWPANEYRLWLKEKGERFTAVPRPETDLVCEGMPEAYHPTTWHTDRAIEFIQVNGAFDAPWFLSVNFYDPHHPFDPPAEYLERALKRSMKAPLPGPGPRAPAPSPFLENEWKNGAYNRLKEYRWENLSPQAHRCLRAAYWAMIDLLDHQIGRILDALEKSGQMKNTIVVFMSDHGEMLGDHGVYLKGPHFYECSVRVPLILSWRGKLKPAVKENALVELTDVAPTLLELAGLEVPEGMQGLSMRSWLTESSGADEFRDTVYSEYLNAMSWHTEPAAYVTMVRDDRYKLICHHGKGLGGELYDLLADPEELHNLWNEPKCGEIRFALLKTLCDRMAFACDPLPVRRSDF